jgi:hypothetical protein
MLTMMDHLSNTFLITSINQFNLTSLQVFRSGMQAAKELGIQQTTISQCCLGRRGPVNNFGFRFLDQHGQQFAEHDLSSSDSDVWTGAGSPQRKRFHGSVDRRGGGGRSKAIVQFDLNTGETIATYSSGKVCSDATGITRNSISLCCSGRQHGTNNFGFRFVNPEDTNVEAESSDDYDDSSGKRLNKNRKAVEQYDIASGVTIQEFTSTTHAADVLGLQKSRVSLCCIGRLKAIGDFGFRFADPVEREKVEQNNILRKMKTTSSTSVGHGNNHKKKPVERFDLATGETIETFSSGSAAASALGLHRTCVSLCCVGKQKGVDGYGFRFADPVERDRAVASESSQKRVEMFDYATGVNLEVML